MEGEGFEVTQREKVPVPELLELIKVIYSMQLAVSGDPWYYADKESVLLSQQTKWEVECRLIFERADIDRSGSIDFDEFVAAANGMPVLSLGFELFCGVSPAFSTNSVPLRTVRYALSS